MKFRPKYNLLKKEMRKETELEMASGRIDYCSGFYIHELNARVWM